MRDAMPDDEAVLLDACSLIGLFATRRIEAILAARAAQFCIVDVVAGETSYVLKCGDGDDADEREPIDVHALKVSGVVSLLSTTDEDELLTFIDLTQELDEGEAMTGAIAIHRGLKVVTDDRKALRVLTEYGVECETTLDLIKRWFESQAISSAELRVTLFDLRQRARYVPHKQHHLRDWWETSIS